MMMENEKEHVISEREKLAWQQSKQMKRSEIAPLSRKQEKVFLQLMAENQSFAMFQQKLSLSLREFEFHKDQLGVNDPYEARKLLDGLVDAEAIEKERLSLSEAQKVREAREAAERRLEEMKVEPRRSIQRLDPNIIKQQDAERQRRFSEQQSITTEIPSNWSLEDQDELSIKRFENDIVMRGLEFCREKYSVTNNDIKSQAQRFNLKIDWDLVR